MKSFVIITFAILLIQLNIRSSIGQSFRFGGSLGFGGIKSLGSFGDKSEANYDDDAASLDLSELEDDEEDIVSNKPIYNIKDAPQLFTKFIKDFNKMYKNDADYKAHYNNFVNNLKEINKVNSNKEFSSTSDINLFSDLSQEERFQFLGGIPTF